MTDLINCVIKVTTLFGNIRRKKTFSSECFTSYSVILLRARITINKYVINNNLITRFISLKTVSMSSVVSRSKGI